MTCSFDVDPGGDLVLKLGPVDEPILIRVSSKVLSLASPVFAAMLSPRFAEGQALEDSKGMVNPTTTTIALPDDDPNPMSVICCTLHFKENATQRKLYSPELIMGLAVICDKYRMSRALSPWSNIWMEKFQLEDQDDHFDTAGISYGLEHHETFWKSTRDILRQSKLAELDIEHGLLPDKVIDTLRIARKSLLDHLQSRLENLVTLLLEYGCATKEYEGRVQSCEHLIILGKYIKCLYDRGFWPISKVQICSISEILRLFDSFPKLESSSVERQMVGGTGCLTCQEVYFRDLLEQTVGYLDRKVTGLCLSCVKHGRYTEKEGNCHAELECQFLAKDRALDKLAKRLLGH